MTTKITDAMNTYNPALNEIIKDGYKVSIMENDKDGFEWQAEKSGSTFIAGDPLRLLATIIIWERAGEVWNRQNIPDYYNQILDAQFKI